jgi:CelD/BcsL family acetyltransferase involved in cellulose biosynthesis
MGPELAPAPQGDVPTRVIVSGVADFAALAPKWRDLETRSTLSFFQSWTWTGCLAKVRQEINLFRITSWSQAIGFIYNFRYRRHSLAYQSGLTTPVTARARSPA